ncbi:MAG: VWA domain-containing protein, partial [Planctomycetota bacterium]
RAARKTLEVREFFEKRGKLAALTRPGLEYPAVQATLLDLLEDDEWTWRALALLQLRDAGEELPVPLALRALEALRDEAWSVRIAAAESLARARMRDVVEPMIAAMEKDRNERVRKALGLSLYRITGVNHASWPVGWRRWWDKQGYAFAVPLEAPAWDPPPKSRKATGERKSVASFYGINLGSSRVIFLIDASGSMAIEDRKGARARFDVALDELERAFRKLPVGAKTNVIFFSDRIDRWRPKLSEVKPGMRKSIRRTLASRRPDGGTHLYDGFEAAFEDGEVDTIVLLSDGQPSGGKVRFAEDIERAILEWNELRRLTIHCVAVGYHSPMLQRLAAASGGQYVKR